MLVERAARRVAAMEIGDLVTYEGRTFLLRGFDPTGVPDRRAELEDPVTGEHRSVLFALVGPADSAPADPGETLS
jgi:hypothetical protein